MENLQEAELEQIRLINADIAYNTKAKQNRDELDNMIAKNDMILNMIETVNNCDDMSAVLRVAQIKLLLNKFGFKYKVDVRTA